MSRPIKFRVRYREGWAPFKEATVYLTLDEIAKGHVVFNHTHIVVLSIDEFTGITDTQKRDIYEGDLFNCIYKSDGHDDHVYSVIYYAPKTGFRLHRYGAPCPQNAVYQEIDDVARYGIIGNIHMDKELLK